MKRKIIIILLKLFLLNSCFANTFLFKYNGEYGVLDENLNVKLSPKFKQIILCKDGIFAVLRGDIYLFSDDSKPIHGVDGRLNNNCFLYDFDCQFSTEIETHPDIVSSVFYLYDSLYCLTTSFYDYIYDLQSKKITKTPYSYHIARNMSYKELSNIEVSKIIELIGKEFSEEYIVNGLSFDSSVRIARIFPFVNDCAVVLKSSNSPYADSDFSLINSKGEILISKIFNCGWQFKDGLLPVITDKGSGFINSDCEFVIKCPLYSEGSGTISVEPGLKSSFSEGFAYVRTEKNEYKILDKNGNVYKILSYSTESVNGFCEGLLPVKDKNHFGYINTKGELIIPFVLDEANDFNNGYAIVKYKNEDGIMDKNGNVYLSKNLIYGEKSFLSILLLSD